MNTKWILILINVLGILGALIWLMKEGGWEPIVTVIGLIGSLIALLYYNNSGNAGTTMKQRSGKGSTNYQAGGNIKINNSRK